MLYSIIFKYICLKIIHIGNHSSQCKNSYEFDCDDHVGESYLHAQRESINKSWPAQCGSIVSVLSASFCRHFSTFFLISSAYNNRRYISECWHIMSYTELEHGYQGLRKATRPTQFYVGGVSVLIL